jgi:hypothetical protein
VARPVWGCTEGGSPTSLKLLLILFGGLEILAGLLALISPPPMVSLQLEVPVVWIAAVLTRLFGAEVFSLGLACL